MLSGYALNKPKGESVDVSKFMAQFENLPKFTVDPGDSPSIGPNDAKIKIVEFSDFQCPACKAAFKSLKPVIRKYKDKIKFTYKHFPLDMSCNDLLKNRLHPAACDASTASLCVKKQLGDEGFFKYHDELFHNQTKISKKYIIDLAHQSVPNKDSWDECFNSSETLAEIRDDIRLATELGVQATPTLFVNGRRVEGALTRKQLEALIDHSKEIN
jgi:protein-disulfide isomerase